MVTEGMRKYGLHRSREGSQPLILVQAVGGVARVDGWSKSASWVTAW